MCININEKKVKIRDEITNGDSGNGWKPSGSKFARTPACISVFTRSYPQSGTVERAVIVLTLDANGDIRCYPHLQFRKKRTDDWQGDFFKLASKLSGMKVERVEHTEDTESGIAVNAILKDQSWRNWTLPFPTDAIETLRECCRKLREWTDAYVASLP